MKSSAIIGAIIVTVFFGYKLLWRAPIVKPPASVIQNMSLRASAENAARERLLRTIYSGNLTSVRKEFDELVAAGYDKDAFTRMHLARFYLTKAQTSAAIDHLQWILHPPQGYDSTLQSSGEPMALWLDLVSPSDPRTVSFLHDWIERRRVQSTQVRDSMDPSKKKLLEDAADPEVSDVSRVYLAAAQELEASGPVEKIATYYEKARINSPKSYSVMHQVGVFKLRHGDSTGGRRAYLDSYRLAPSKAKEYAARLNDLTPEQVHINDFSQ